MYINTKYISDLRKSLYELEQQKRDYPEEMLVLIERGIEDVKKRIIEEAKRFPISMQRTINANYLDWIKED